MSKTADLSSLNAFGPETNVPTRMPIHRMIEIRANKYQDPYSHRDYLPSAIDTAIEMYRERRLLRAAPEMAAAIERALAYIEAFEATGQASSELNMIATILIPARDRARGLT